MKVVLFCGGLGQRMRETGSTVLKPMVLIGNRPLLWHVMRYYAHFGHHDFVLCLGHGAASIKEYFLNYDETLSNDFRLEPGGNLRLFSKDLDGWSITFVDTGLSASIGDRLLQARPYLQGEEMFLANYSDTLSDADLPLLIERFRRTDSIVSLLAVPPTSTHHVVETDLDGMVTGLRAVRDLPQWENGGYFIMRPEIFDNLRRGEDLVPEAFNRVMSQKRLMAQRYLGFWRAVDTFKDRAELEAMYLRGDTPWMVWRAAAIDLDAMQILADTDVPLNGRTGNLRN